MNFLPLLLALGAPQPAAPDFNRDVRPILSNHCFKCHGPAVQKAKLRLDSFPAATKTAIVPGKPEASELLKRIGAHDDTQMPPKEAGLPLTAKQIETLRQWVVSGAEYAPHWSFVPPVRPAVPKGEAHPADAFVRAKLTEAKLKPSAEADRAVLIRRVTLDLIGLLPSPEEVAAFVNDKTPDAYAKLVDKLLASEHYGERQARHWLDLARYADSNGYTIDGARSIWPYRDWVVSAFNRDLPFDEFTVEQLAGDLLAKPAKDQLIATGFHRNTSFNEEGGTDAEQFRVERVVDRTNTTAAVWLGLTVGCAQCHDHKYDPVSQAEYYKLYAFFNSSDEPSMSLGGTPDLDKKVAELTERLAAERLGGNDEVVKKTIAELKKVQGQVPSTLIMKERAKPRETFVQIRGDFLRRGDAVKPGYPAAVVRDLTPRPPLRSGEGETSRLDLARWLVSRDHPLTSRVFVNRAWQQFFGRGLVETENDFGMQGAAPTHPELLDYLAVEFREPTAKGAKPWSIQALYRLIVTSATYKQSSVLRNDLKDADPQNKLLARQARLRLEAEIIRDATLSASGLLSRKLGGPGVYPPLPPEVFAFTQSKHPWPESKGEDRYRRGLYTHVWRQSQHHLMTTFDGADAQTACTKRNRSNTPLQALHLANDPAFVEFAAALGARLEKEGGASDAERIDFAYRICFGRTPSAGEAEVVVKYLRKGDAKTAWTRTARVLMNLDEFVTRE